jgi:hypothetical protein
VIVNLVVNARDAMGAGGRLTLSTEIRDLGAGASGLRADAAPGRYVVLSVADTGTGMDEQTMAHLFEPFFTTKEAGKGTGLGLATVHGIVAQSGGFVEVRSELGRGTTFEIHLPWFDSQPERIEAPAAGPRREGGNETILLVEDSAPVRHLTRELLEASGYRVLEAADGEAALLVAARHPGSIDLLLTDLVLGSSTARATPATPCSRTERSKARSTSSRSRSPAAPSPPRSAKRSTPPEARSPPSGSGRIRPGSRHETRAPARRRL